MISITSPRRLVVLLSLSFLTTTSLVQATADASNNASVAATDDANLNATQLDVVGTKPSIDTCILRKSESFNPQVQDCYSTIMQIPTTLNLLSAPYGFRDSWTDGKCKVEIRNFGQSTDTFTSLSIRMAAQDLAAGCTLIVNEGWVAPRTSGVMRGLGNQGLIRLRIGKPEKMPGGWNGDNLSVTDDSNGTVPDGQPVGPSATVSLTMVATS